MRITVVGLGKIGLPLAVQYARKGHTVIGADINVATVDLVNAATEPFPGEHLLQEYLTEVVAAGLLTATTDTTAAVRGSDVVVVAVPLFVDDDAVPDFRAMDAAATAIGKGLTSGTLVSFETTLPIGTTRTRLTPILEADSGLNAGTDFFVVFSPERVFTGRVFADLRKYPKLVGGIDEASGRRGIDFYEAVLDFDERPDLDRPNGVWDLGSAEAAEFAKLAETTYRDVNIGLANQFARYADKIGVDIYKVIEACNSQPFSHIHQPGIAVGGHCIPVYPRLYLWNDPDATIVRAARDVNTSMPEYAVALLERELGGLCCKTVVVLGAAYRGGVKETAFSGVFCVVEELELRGATVLVHDPLFSASELTALGFTEWTAGVSVDGAVVQSDHREYRDPTFLEALGANVIVDGRRVIPSELASPRRVLVVGGGRYPDTA
jgi:nucleotide sugar dehydrogenase